MTPETKSKVIYWAVTAPFLFAIGAGGLAMLMGVPQNVEGLVTLGYPVYMCYILGTAKVLGVIATVVDRFKTLKEWAYAGFTFSLLGASASHHFHGDELAKVMTPLVILVLVLTSYRLWKAESAPKA